MASTAALPPLPKPADTLTTDSKKQQPYSFTAQPKPVQAARPKYREQNAQQQKIPVNMMYDPRVYRGNTYASAALPLRGQQDPVELQHQNELMRKKQAKKKADLQRRVRTPDAVEGRKHIEVQTELYLEELSDKVPEAYAGTQTDAFLDRAPSPFYVPQKSGIDVATQIYPGELFDFDFEVQPILEVLVGKTLEQALMEIMEEDELDHLRKRQDDFDRRRNAELAEVQRLEDAERRRTEEKERRLVEAERLAQEKREAAEKIAARAFAQSYLTALIPSVFDKLNNLGFFYDSVEKEVASVFLPWLSTSVEKNISKVQLAQKLLDDILVHSIRSLRRRK